MTEITDIMNGLLAAEGNALHQPSAPDGKPIPSPRPTPWNPWFRLRRHPVPVVAHFQFSLVLTYAVDAALLKPLLPPGLELDEWRGLGFVAVAMVQTGQLRPAGFPRWLGQDFFLTGYRIFARHRLPDGRRLRGLRILRSDTNRRWMVVMGNRLTHYNYRLAEVRHALGKDQLEIEIKTPGTEADLQVRAHWSAVEAPLPAGSPFANWHEARQFAGPLPFTFDYEPETHSLILIEGVRARWHPQPVTVQVGRNTFFDRAPFDHARPVLASAFYVADVPYRWKRGVVEPLAAI